ncbi:MAG: site-specific DNA-methyltransferase [Synechococcus sp. SB0678_bin_12]|nr:site-specific DNA-methyltransferase [Synechococcus sp. SB0678_bin_12]
MARRNTPKIIETLRHESASRRNIPTAEHEPVMAADDRTPIAVAYERRNRDLDPQLVWRGKDQQNWSDLVVQAPPLFIQEKIHPQALINDLLRHSRTAEAERLARQFGSQTDLFADFNGLPDGADRTEFYRHEANWSNRMILGDSLQVMASLAEREGLRGRVQCIYLDPPYGIKFNSNFQWSTTSRDVKDGKAEHITREPEQVKAFRDTWRDGIHSYLTYLRDRLTVARDLLTESGSIFVQIGDENVHRVRAVMDEVFGEGNFVSLIVVWKTSSQTSAILPATCDYIMYFAKSREHLKYRQLFSEKNFDNTDSSAGEYKSFWVGFGKYFTDKQATEIEKQKLKRFRPSPTTSQSGSDTTRFPFRFRGVAYRPGPGGWKSNNVGFRRLTRADRIMARQKSLSYVRFLEDFPVVPISELWTDVRWGFDASLKRYVVETNPRVVQRCILMATDPGDLVLDPTCGSGTTAYVAEQWGRRWITIDTSRVALALARARIMGARYPYYLLADSPEGQQKEAEIAGTAPPSASTHGNVRLGFVCERVPHVTLKSIANNAEIDVIWEKFQKTLEPLRSELNTALGTSWEEWEIPRAADDTWPEEVSKVHADWWKHRIARQEEIDASIATKADYEYLYDKPYQDKKKVRVAGPFTVESISPHRILGVDENDDPIDTVAKARGEAQDFASVILEHLKTAGVQQAHKEDRIVFSSLTPWPGELICAQGCYGEGGDEAGAEKRAAVFIGSEFGTVPRADLAAAAREAAEADFDVLIACAFNYEAHAADFNKLGRIPILKARMNADLHMADNLKNTGKGNLFVIFGEPDIDILPVAGSNGTAEQFQVRINGVDVFHPNTGEIRSHGADGIACWFVDTDYNEESFFVRHAYFLGAGDPYKALKTTLKAEIHQEAWATLNSDTSRPFQRPASGRIAVKVINHLGDEVMKVFRV